ncbi:hypothetical protein IJD34_08175 [bacterium]|nr:hypothetical protein [bacterium]
MNIQTNHGLGFKALIPKSEYKSVILKLTPKDKKKISELITKKSQIELELDSVEKLLDKKKTLLGSFNLSCRHQTLLGEIALIEEMIKNIKLNRLEKQKKKLNKIV